MDVQVPYVFEFVAGRPALDFVNTTSDTRSVVEQRISKERLTSYGELLRWATERGVLSPEQARRIQAAAQRTPEQAEHVLDRAVRLREALFALFEARVRGRRLEREPLELVNGELANALRHQRLVEGGEGLELSWDAALALDAMLWPVVRDASELLSSPELLRRVKICEASHEHRCDWLFLDETKSNTRRWCSMKECGNRAKQRRHYERTKRAEDG